MPAFAGALAHSTGEKNIVNVEELRQHHRPEKILTLFVGESAPAGGTYFYAENSQMYRYMREVFGSPPGLRPGTRPVRTLRISVPLVRT